MSAVGIERLTLRFPYSDLEQCRRTAITTLPFWRNKITSHSAPMYRTILTWRATQCSASRRVCLPRYGDALDVDCCVGNVIFVLTTTNGAWSTSCLAALRRSPPICLLPALALRPGISFFCSQLALHPHISESVSVYCEVRTPVLEIPKVCTSSIPLPPSHPSSFWCRGRHASIGRIAALVSTRVSTVTSPCWRTHRRSSLRAPHHARVSSDGVQLVPVGGMTTSPRRPHIRRLLPLLPHPRCPPASY